MREEKTPRTASVLGSIANTARWQQLYDLKAPDFVAEARRDAGAAAPADPYAAEYFIPELFQVPSRHPVESLVNYFEELGHSAFLALSDVTESHGHAAHRRDNSEGKASQETTQEAKRTTPRKTGGRTGSTPGEGTVRAAAFVPVHREPFDAQSYSLSRQTPPVKSPDKHQAEGISRESMERKQGRTSSARSPRKHGRTTSAPCHVSGSEVMPGTPRGSGGRIVVGCRGEQTAGIVMAARLAPPADEAADEALVTAQNSIDSIQLGVYTCICF